MGSGTKRSTSDKVIIAPKKRLVKTKMGGSFSRGSVARTRGKFLEERTCPTSFKVKLSPGLKLKTGTKVVARPVGKTVAFFFGDTEVARLSLNKGHKIALYITKGFQYKGIVKEEGRAVYVEAFRTI